MKDLSPVINEDLRPGPYVVLMEDELIHTDEHTECDDLTCPCHGEQSSVELIVSYEDVTESVDLNPS